MKIADQFHDELRDRPPLIFEAHHQYYMAEFRNHFADSPAEGSYPF